MKRIFGNSTLPALCLIAIGGTTLAPPAPAHATTMDFQASPAIAVSGYASYPHVVQVHNNDVTNVIVHQPVACGERLTGASYEIEGKFLLPLKRTLVQVRVPMCANSDYLTGSFRSAELLDRDTRVPHEANFGHALMR